MRLRSFLVALPAVLAGCAAHAEGPITLHYEERAPYIVGIDHNTVRGLTATPAAEAFREAGVPFVWEMSSMNRQMHLMMENEGRHCVVGWFKTPERQRSIKFTKPIYRDRPLVALVRRQVQILDGSTLARVLMTPRMRVIVRTNYSYGPYADKLLATARPEIISSAQPNSRLVEMLRGNRADFLFVADEEAEHLLRQSEANVQELRQLRFPDVGSGEARHIACNRQVADDIILRLNGAITFQ